MAISIEEKLQSQCTQWFWNTYFEHRQMLFHVDNNSWNNIIGARKKALGVVQGVADLILILDRAVWFLEMKKPGGVQTPEQKDFQQKVQARGHTYLVIQTFEQFKSLICELIGK